MHAKKDVYEYAILRVVPRVERGEFLNVGVVVYCRSQSFLKVMITVDETRLLALFPDIDLDNIKAHLHSFENICLGHKVASPIARLDATSRFRWLTARRSSVIQASEVHPGLCSDANATLQKLHEELVAI